MNKRSVWTSAILTLIATLGTGCHRPSTTTTAQRRPAYPQARKEAVVDTYHGTEVADPYRWLEDADSDETQTWVARQNDLTERFLARTGARERIKARLKSLTNYPRCSSPSKQGGRYFFWKNDGLQNQSVLYVQDTLDGEARVVVNPNVLSADGTVAVTTAALNWDGTKLAYGLSHSGSDEQEVRIREVNWGMDLDEVLQWCRFTTIAWHHDGSGFFYSRFPDPITVSEEDRMNYNRLYWHRLGTPQSADVLIYERPDNKELSLAPVVTEDGRYLVLYLHHGTDPRNRVYYRPLEGDGPFVRLLDEADARYDFLGNQGPIFYFLTNSDAPKGRIIAIDTDRPAQAHWSTVIPESDGVIDYAAWVDNQLVLVCMHDVHHRLKVFHLDGQYIRDIDLPGLGTIGSLSGRQDDPEMFFSFTSFLYPSTSLGYDLPSNELRVIHQPEIDFDLAAYETRQVFCTSRDGTRIPMFITHRKGLTLDGSHPTLLYGYGGFNINIMPGFSTSTLAWLEAGGVYVQANMRGGSEYGESWHQAGMLENKQNVFDDFIAAAEWLIENNYTQPAKLAIRGGSNGGLLVAACMLQRPHLYGAVVCQVPVIDMLRYHKFTVGRYWVPEYGNAEASKQEFGYLYAYSPLHNVKAGVGYPPILITSADTDDRVVPLHAKKFAATLQEKAVGDNPILLRVETKAGHGGGKPVSKAIEEQADIYTFLFDVLGMQGRR
ncbi:MAG: prolyl oligopeptidase family serine peptidase [Sedimentisphaerales bacterium]|nr:prolyl oligopeptidase family serine peptidase [Sedimentisphaerales bacterium]HNY76885.1 prolyl oligopeptidase family serine peptidase [Sedimentisphaerales bacterium]HOC62739.1 prolyl oligopeptidase family serine peptidase [Sedimentisphaerales bacterium]HOH62659.1 prolyl oligopeptidase family serine peptidase [Sedimentisphaerales bacterium]HPY51554.1 prolyl oligopeptidase family serine peptidase [Sedimentisphaerales bacterium]